MRHLPLAWVLLVVSNLYAQTSGEFSRQAQELIRRYQWEEAAQLLGKGLHTYPESASLLLRLGALRTQMGSPTEGEALLKKALTLQPVNPEAWHQIGEAQLRQGQSASAVDSFRKAIQLDPANPRHHYRLAYALFTRGEEHAALKSAQEATRLKPDSPAIRRLYAVLLHCTGDQRESSQQLRQAHILAPGDARLLFQLSEERRLKKQWSQALEYLDKVQRLQPDDPTIQEQILGIKLETGIHRMEAREWKAALEIFEPAIEKGSADSDTYLRSAYYQQLNQLRRAVRLYRVGLASDPTTVWARTNLAICLSRLRRHQEAAEEWQGIVSESRTPEAYLQLGLSYSHLQRFPESEEALRQARELGNDSPRLIYHLGLAKLHNHRLEEAWDLIHRAARAGCEPALEMTRKGARWTETKGRARARVKTD